MGMARSRSGGIGHHFVWAPPGRQGASPLEVPIGVRNFGIPKLSEYRFGMRTDGSYFFGQF